MSDLMLVSGKDIENYIQKLSQMARAAEFILLWLQRPSVDVIIVLLKLIFQLEYLSRFLQKLIVDNFR